MPGNKESQRSRTGLTGIVLIGGRSSRLGGEPKPLIVVGNKLILARIADALRSVCDEVIAVVRPGQEDASPDTAMALGMHVVEDTCADAGPLAGCCAGLRASVSALSFVTGGDHPFLSADLIRAMARTASTRGAAVVPHVDGRLQPLHAVYPTLTWRTHFCEALANGEHSPTRVLASALAAGTSGIVEYGVRQIEEHDPRLMSLVDVDTPSQLARARIMSDWRTNVRPGLRHPGGA